MMHLVATDFSLWIRILIEETQHEFKIIAAKKRNISLHAEILENTNGFYSKDT